MDTFNLGIKFVKGWQDPCIVASDLGASNSDIFGDLAQTGDSMLFVGFVLIFMFIAYICGLAYIRNRRVCSSDYSNLTLSTIFKPSNFNIRQKFILGLLGIVAFYCIGIGEYGIAAHANESVSSLSVDKTEIEAVVNEDYSFTIDTCTLLNSGMNKYSLTQSAVSISDDASGIESLVDSHIKITSQEGKTIYSGNPDGNIQPISDFFIEPSGSNKLSFNISFDDARVIDSLFNVRAFTVSLNYAKGQYNVIYDGNSATGNPPSAENNKFLNDTFIVPGQGNLTTPEKKVFCGWNTQSDGFGATYKTGEIYTVLESATLYALWMPYEDNLYEYSLEDLQRVSDYLEKNYPNDTDPVCIKFQNFKDNGLTSDGSDNGVAMGEPNSNASNHWAIDKNGLLYNQYGFENSDTTIQVRIIGIKEDIDSDGEPIGLTFMSTHSINEYCQYNRGDNTYGWSGSSGDPLITSCDLRTFINTGSWCPATLQEKVKAAQKGYQYSEASGNNVAIDKFWVPSAAELWGTDVEHDTHSWPDNNGVEGSQYSAFVNHEITCINALSFINMQKGQTGSTSRPSFCWTRTLIIGSPKGAGAYAVYSNSSGKYVSSNIGVQEGVIACFCI